MGRGKAKPTHIVAGKRPQLRSGPARGWSAAKEAAFLAMLGASCNVTLAAREAGVSSSNAYKRRQVDAGFRRRWVQAVHEGYARLELALLSRALVGSGEPLPALSDDAEARGAAAIEALPPTIMLAMLKMHRATAAEGAPGDELDDEARATELRAKIAGKLDRLRRRTERA